jgi:glyoxylase-like metal-dependent hydrolase (beta-lactamase superfamily II)
MLIPIALPLCYAFLLKGERSILIDTGRPQDAAAIEHVLRSNGVALAELALILHTHGHWDHAGSTAELRRLTAAPLAVHVADAPLVRRGDNGVLRPTGLWARLLRPFLDRGYPAFEPDLLIEREMDLSEYGVAARVVFTPGHTSGSISVLTGEGDMVVGDLLMGGYFGGLLLPGRPGLHYFVDDMAALTASVRKVLGMGPRCVYPAHGGPLEPKAVEQWVGVRC